MSIEYKNTPIKTRNMDQHSQCLLDMYREIIDIRDAVAADIVERINNNDEKFDDDKLLVSQPHSLQESKFEIIVNTHLDESWSSKVSKMYDYMFKHFPVPADTTDNDWKKQLDCCSVHVFNMTKDTTHTFEIMHEISGTDLMWNVPPKTMYEMLPVVIIRDALRHRKIDKITKVVTMKRGKNYNPFRKFANIYGKIILAA